MYSGIWEIVTIISALLIAITVHEFSHALIANFFGDPTAKLAGRLTLNPIKHIDPAGALMMILIHLGWGKPVPVNPRYFKKPKRDEALTAVAGPTANILLALLITLPLKYLGQFLPLPVHYFLGILLDINIGLFIFNMLPFPPLDGSKFLGFLIPKKYEALYKRYLQGGMTYFILFVLFDLFVLSKMEFVINGKLVNFSILEKITSFIFALVKSSIFLGS